MARSTRVDVGNEVYHVINRANARLPIFFEKEDYKIFESILQNGKSKYNMRILAYCLMPNHFHLVLHPREDGDLQKFMQWVTLTHTQQWHFKNKTVGSGHLYQGRYKSFIIEKSTHLLTVIRYVERNPLRAALVTKAENWEFSSLYKRTALPKSLLLDDWPINEPKDYVSFVNMPLVTQEENEVRHSVNKGKPYGGAQWSDDMIKRYNLLGTLRNVGRPRNGT